MTATPRTTFRFSAQEAEFAARLKRSGSAEAVAVRDLNGPEDLRSVPAATLLHVLIDVGMQTIQQRAEKIRYERLAEFLKDDPEHRAWHASRAAWRARRIAQQETV